MLEGWHDWFGTFTGVVIVTVAVLPLAALVVWALARRRIATGAAPVRAWRMSLAEVGIVHGTVPWVWMIMMPGDRAGAVPAQYVLRLDRVSSVDDVLINAAGAGLAALASRRWWRAGLSDVSVRHLRRRDSTPRST